MILKLWPTRSKYKDAEPVTDLDAIIAAPVTFRFDGKIHKLKPMQLDEYLKFSNAQSRLLANLKDDAPKLNARELARQYLDVVSSICDTITIEDILRMEQVQVAALYQLIIDITTGQVKTEAGKKKSRQKIQIYDSVEHSSLQNVPESLAGHTSKP